MFRILFLFAFIGAGAFAASTHQETYRYSGMISAGILNPREAAAGSTVDMTIVVKRDADWKAEVQFKDAKIREINSLHFEKAIYDSPRSWQRAAELEGTVTAYLSRDTGTVMEVPNSQKHWVNEIQKSIINILRIPPYLGRSLEVDTHNDQIRKLSAKDRTSFHETEETFAGRCNVSYTMTPIVETRIEEQAAQRYYRLLRSIDFNSCHLPVQITKSSHGNYSHVHQSQFKEVQTRSAVASYILRPRQSDRGYDILNVTQHGHQITKPFGQDTGRLVVKSNQTLSLIEVKESYELSPVVSAVPIKSWQYQFVSPAAPKSGSTVPWVIYKSKAALYPIYPEYMIMGEEHNYAEVVKRVKTMLNEITLLQLQDVEDYNRPYNGTTDGRVTEMMNTLAKTIRGLTFSDVKSLYDFTRTQRSTEDRVRRQSFLDASIASGSASALRALVEEYKSGHIDYIRMAGLITLYSNNVFDPESIPMLLDFVKTLSLSRDGFYLPMLANLNFARLAHRVCVHPNTKLYSVPHYLLGSKICEAKNIQDSYVSFLTNIISRSSSIYEHIIYLQSLGSLGIDSTIPQIKEYIVGHAYENRSITFRLAAIYALDVNFPERHQRQKVIDILLPVAEDHSQSTVLREAAFMTIMAAKPNETILHRFALGTWRDPSYQMRSLVSSTFVSLAISDTDEYDILSKTASNLIGRMRFVEPSMSNALYFITKSRLQDYEIDIRNGLGWLNGYVRPRLQNKGNLHSLEVEYGGINVPILELFSLSSSLRSGQYESHHDSRHPAHRQVMREMKEYNDAIEKEMNSESVNIYTYMSGFNYQSIFANDLATIKSVKENVMSWVTNSVDLSPSPFLPNQTVKYFNPVDIVSILPTPFGTPAIIEVTTPNNWMWNLNYTMTLHRGERNITLDGNSKMTMKTQSYVSLLMPWCNVTASAGIDTEATISVPGKLSVLQKSSYPHSIVKTDISPRFRGERPLLYYRNKPLTTLRPIGPLSDLTSVEDILTVKSKPPSPYKWNYEVPKDVFGLKAKFVYEGEVSPPVQQSVWMDVYENPTKLITILTTPTAKDLSLSYRVDMDASETKNITVAAVIDVGYLTGQKRSVSRKQSSPKSGEDLAQKLTLDLSPEEMIVKAKDGELGNFLYSLHVNYTTPNVKTRQYEVVLSGINQTSVPHGTVNESLILNIMQKGMANPKGETKTCFVTNMTEDSRPETEGEGSVPYTFMATSVYAGQKCQPSEKIGTIRSTWYLSQDKTICSPHGVGCSINDEHEARTPWRMHPVYTRIDFELRATKTPFPRYFENITYWISDMATGHSFPSAVINYGGAKDIAKNYMTINITRHNASDVVDTWVRTNSQITRVESYPFTPLLDWMTPLLGTTPIFSSRFSVHSSRPERSSRPTNYCFLDNQRVNSFDGVSYERVPSECWTVVTRVDKFNESFSILSRRPKKLSNEVEVKLQMPQVGDIVIKGSEVWVRGQLVQHGFKILNNRNEVIGLVKKSEELVMLVIHDKVAMNVGADKFGVLMAKKYKGYVRGMCGDFNGETVADLRTPEGCILTSDKGNVFAASWIADKESCRDSEAMQNEMTKCHRSISWNHHL